MRIQLKLSSVCFAQRWLLIPSDDDDGNGNDDNDDDDDDDDDGGGGGDDDSGADNEDDGDDDDDRQRLADSKTRNRGTTRSVARILALQLSFIRALLGSLKKLQC